MNSYYLIHYSFNTPPLKKEKKRKNISHAKRQEKIVSFEETKKTLESEQYRTNWNYQASSFK